MLSNIEGVIGLADQMEIFCRSVGLVRALPR
jgi:hypothetical protein